MDHYHSCPSSTFYFENPTRSGMCCNVSDSDSPCERWNAKSFLEAGSWKRPRWKENELFRVLHLKTAEKISLSADVQQVSFFSLTRDCQEWVRAGTWPGSSFKLRTFMISPNLRWELPTECSLISPRSFYLVFCISFIYYASAVLRAELHGDFNVFVDGVFPSFELISWKVKPLRLKAGDWLRNEDLIYQLKWSFCPSIVYLFGFALISIHLSHCYFF